MKAINAVITGQVQGVGFRMYIFRQAVRLGLYGWVQNCTDGSVELHAQGGDVDLEYFIQLVNRGNNFSVIEDTKVVPTDVNDVYKCFEVKM